MSFTVITHKLSCSLQLRLLDISLSLSLSPPLPLDEPVVIDAKEDKELAPSDMSARLSLYSPDAYRNCGKLLVVTTTTVTVHTTFHRSRHLIWSQYFLGLHFQTMAFYVFL